MSTEATRKVAPPELLKAIELNYKRRVINEASRRNAAHEVEFFVGAMSALSHVGFEIPVGWSLKIMSGRPVVDGNPREWAAEQTRM